MTPEQSRQAGQALMALAVVQLVVFLVGAARKSYVALAIPVFGILLVFSGVAVWVGWTMAVARWDEDEPED